MNTPYSSFFSYIQLNRSIPTDIFKDSKLLCLATICALRTKRANHQHTMGVKLEVGEFIIGRTKVVGNTDLSDTEYRTRIKKLEDLEIIKKISTTSGFTKYRWLENPYISVNLDFGDTQDNQLVGEDPATNNNINNNLINLKSSYFNSNYNFIFNKLNINILTIVVIFLRITGMDKKGPELFEDFVTANKMLEAGRKVEEAQKFMKWLQDKCTNEIEEYPWTKMWTLNTVQKKLPDFIAGRLEDPNDKLPFGGMYEKVKLGGSL